MWTEISGAVRIEHRGNAVYHHAEHDVSVSHASARLKSDRNPPLRVRLHRNPDGVLTAAPEEPEGTQVKVIRILTWSDSAIRRPHHGFRLRRRRRFAIRFRV
jgi:hypothetical protein